MQAELSAYLPVDRFQALADGRNLPDRAQGAVLFADISGFTALTEDLAAHLGPRRGAEELAVRLNRVYDALIEKVHAFGGSVISFAGDAITCWFDDGHTGASPRAVACALAQQRAMAQFEGLSLKVGVASGPARRLLVGDPELYYLDTLAGATIARMAAAERLARQGEVVVDAPTVAALGEASVLQWRADPKTNARFAVIDRLIEPAAAAPWPNSRTLTGDRLRPWLLPALYERLHQGLGEYLTELRPAVALFLRFEGIDYDGDPAAVQRLDAYIRWIQAVLARYEANVVQLIIGDKGSYLVAAFGAPIAHEDDARRAITAALEIVQPPETLDFIRPVQIGVSQGTARTGAYGGTQRRTYGVLGEEVNLAARLMQHAAPGQVLASGRVRKAAARAFAWEALAPIRLKGMAETVTVYHPRGPVEGFTRPMTAMVGRSGERALLEERLHDLQKGAGGLVLIEGEAGIGKSRLVDDVLWRARSLDITVLVGAGDSIEQATSYHAWQPVFRQLFVLERADAAEAGLRQVGLRLSGAQGAQLLAQLRTGVPELVHLAPLLNAVLPLDLPDNDATRGLSGAARAEQIRRLLVALLRRAAQTKPLLLIMEDAHWLDSASWTLLRQVVQKVDPLLGLVAVRPLGEPPPPDYARLSTLNGVRRLQLGALSSEDIETLVCERLGVATLPRPVAELIREKSEGHPFFSEELAHALHEAGIICIENGVCRLAPGMEDLRRFDFPDTIEGVIISRIDRLPPQEQLTLKIASVIGRLFAYRLLQDVHPIEADKPHLLEELDDLNRLDLTSLDVPEPDRTYLFKHIVIQEVAYNLMAFAQRRDLHRTVAEWYERVYAADLAAHYPLLAHHWTRAEIWPKAQEYHVLAGDAAGRLYSYLEANRHYAEALAALERLPDSEENRRRRVDLLVKLVSVSFAIDTPEANLDRLTEAERLLQDLPAPDLNAGGDELRLTRVQHWMGRHYFYKGAYRKAIDYLQQAAAAAENLGEKEQLAMVFSMLGQVKTVQGRSAEAEILLSQALAPLEQLSNWPHWVRTVIYLGVAKAARGEYYRGLDLVRCGLKRAEDTYNFTAISTAHLLLWVTHFVGRDVPGMLEESNFALDAAKRAGYGFYEYWGYGFRGWAQMLSGNLEAAAEDFARTRDLDKALGGRPLLADWFAVAEAELALRRHRIEEAVARAEAAVASADAEDMLLSKGLAHRIWAEALAASDPPRWGEAEAQLAVSLRTLESGDNRLEAARTRMAWRRICREQGRSAQALEYEEQAAAQFRASGLPVV